MNPSTREPPVQRIEPVPGWRVPLFWVLRRWAPELDPVRIWNRLDIEAPTDAGELLERRLAAAMRPGWVGVSWGVVAFFLACVALIWGGGPWLVEAMARHGHSWGAWVVPPLMGVVMHGVFILVVHEATHANLFGRRIDHSLGNAALGALLLPYLAERYQHTHVIHHRFANRKQDNNWTRYRHALYERSRLLYALYELVPVLNNLDRLASKIPSDSRQIALSWACALATWAVFRPSVGYCLLVLIGLNAINAMRLWIEHYGCFRGRVANTYWCPFSFGIANHDVHHQFPGIPALALMVGLWFRKRDVTVLSSPFRVLADRRWRHFRLQQRDFDGDVQ